MTITFHPRRLLLTAVFLVAFGATLSSAIDAKSGLAVGFGALAAYAAIEVSLAVNPAAWWQARRVGRG